jgi:lipid A disaccharide synthetase
LLKQARAYYREHKPELQICVDSSGMNLHFARAAKEEGVKVLYYIAPQLWASREGRMKKLRRDVDAVAVRTASARSQGFPIMSCSPARCARRIS